MEMTLIFWALFGALSLVALGFGWVEYQAYTLRSQVKSVPGGLLFTAYLFSVNVSRTDKSVKIICKNGTHKTFSLVGAKPQKHTGPLSLVMPAAGLRVDVSQIGKHIAPNEPPVPTGLSLIVFAESQAVAAATPGKSAGQYSVLELDFIPDIVAQALRHFAEGLSVWFDKLERDLIADIAAQAKEAAAAALAQELASKAAVEPPPPVGAPLSPVEQEVKAKMQLTQWRLAAGFSGTQTDMGFDAFGVVTWLIDLNPDGRVILHSGNRHFHGTLKGSVVNMLADDLEIKVRDEFWQDGDRNLPTFRVLKGASRETLLLWRDRFLNAGEIFLHDPSRHAPPAKFS